MVTLTTDISPRQMAWRNDPRISAFTRQNGLLTEGQMNAWFERIQNNPHINMFGILNEKNENVGTCGLCDIDHTHGKAEFSLLIGPEFQRKGYGRLALIELLKYGFNHLRLMIIFGESFDGNPAIPMFLKLGFVHEGKLRSRYFKNGNYTDSHMVSILRKEAKCQPWWS